MPCFCVKGAYQQQGVSSGAGSRKLDVAILLEIK